MACRQVGVRGAMVHETSSVLAQLWPVGCIPTDLLPSLMAAQCSACTSIASFRHGYRPHVWGPTRGYYVDIAPSGQNELYQPQPAKSFHFRSDLLNASAR